jgi:hypothetical protein
MATQGMVTVRQGGQVVMKIVVGSNGDKAKRVADEIRSLNRVPSRHEAFQLAVRCGFGAKADLVVLNRDGHTPSGETLHALYRDTFDQPKFNPRWECGIVAELEIVDLGAP